MAVEQPNNNKIRPVLDYRELKSFVRSNPGLDAPACDETKVAEYEGTLKVGGPAICLSSGTDRS